MELKRIIYIGNYDNGDSGLSLLTQPSGNTKMKYIIEALCEAGFYVSFVSTAVCSGKEKMSHHTNNYDGYDITYLYSLGHAGLIRRLLSFILINIQLAYFFITIGSDNKVLLYHSPLLTIISQLLRPFYRRSRLFYEVEEIYAVVKKQGKRKIEFEKASLSRADGYIVVNDYINKLCKFKVHSVVCYGCYYAFNSDHVYKRNDNIISVVYAGGLDNDAFLAIEGIEHLPSNYKLYILGYGSAYDENMLKEKISEVNENEGYEKVKFCGCLSGKEYSDFLLHCDIGLCPRSVISEDSLYAFPSKILVYLSHNLVVVSTPHEAIKGSKISDCVVFSTDFTPSSIASAVQSVNMTKVIDNSQVINSLHKEFVAALSNLMS